MAPTREFTFPSADGIHQLYGAAWLPEGCPRAVVQLVHGISEYILRYDDFAAFLTEHGFAVVGHDHLGHGKSVREPSEYGFLAERGGWSLLAEDVRTLRIKAGEQLTGVPYFLMGHSMGSFVARTYLIRWPGSVDGCILSGTGQERAPLVAFGKALCGLIARVRGPRTVSGLVTALTLGAYNRQFRPNRTSADWISRDQKVVDTYVSDPLCAFVPTVGMDRDLMGGIQLIGNPANLKRMDPNTPIYFFSGDQDPVGGNGDGVRRVVQLFEQAGVKDITLKLYPGGRHEMLNECNRSEVYSDVLAWLEAHLPLGREGGELA